VSSWALRAVRYSTSSELATGSSSACLRGGGGGVGGGGVGGVCVGVVWGVGAGFGWLWVMRCLGADVPLLRIGLLGGAGSSCSEYDALSQPTSAACEDRRRASKEVCTDPARRTLRGWGADRWSRRGRLLPTSAAACIVAGLRHRAKSYDVVSAAASGSASILAPA